MHSNGTLLLPLPLAVPLDAAADADARCVHSLSWPVIISQLLSNGMLSIANLLIMKILIREKVITRLFFSVFK